MRKAKNHDGDVPSFAATDIPPPSRGNERSLDSLLWDSRWQQKGEAARPSGILPAYDELLCPLESQQQRHEALPTRRLT